MSIKSKIEDHAATRLDLAGRIAAIGDKKLSQFFATETEALEALKAEVLTSVEEGEVIPALKLPTRAKAKAPDQSQDEGEANDDSV